MRLDRKLWLTADKSEVVEDGDPRAAFLLGSEGAEVPDAEADRLGLTAKPQAKQAAPAEDKQAAEPANKARKAPARKSK